MLMTMMTMTAVTMTTTMRTTMMMVMLTLLMVLVSSHTVLISFINTLIKVPESMVTPWYDETNAHGDEKVMQSRIESFKHVLVKT